MPVPERKQMEALYALFNEFMLDDQRSYYKQWITRNRQAASQVNVYRAAFSLLTGLASALAGLLVQGQYNASGQCAVAQLPAGTSTPVCDAIHLVVGFLLVIAVVAPVLGGAFGTLADLFQWDRLVVLFLSSLENIEVADARSPDPEMDDLTYWASLRAFTEGTLNVMRDETAQWGQLIHTPEQLDKFIADAQAKAAKTMGQQPDTTTSGSSSADSSTGGGTAQVASVTVSVSTPTQPAQPSSTPPAGPINPALPTPPASPSAAPTSDSSSGSAYNPNHPDGDPTAAG
jgi:hypothetical protein